MTGREVVDQITTDGVVIPQSALRQGMVGLIRAELIKLFKRRTFYVLVLVLAIFTGFLALFFFLILPEIEDAFPPITKPGAYLFGAQQVLDQSWFPLILSAMFLAGELATSAWATALTRNARRWQHLLARLLTTTGATWLAMLAAIGGLSLVVLVLAEGSGALEIGEWWGIAWKALLVVFTWVSLGMAASSWLRAVGPAIGATLAFSVIEGLLALWPVWQNVSLSFHTNALMGPLDAGGFGAFAGQAPTFGRSLVVVLAWCAASIAAAWAGLVAQDA